MTMSLKCRLPNQCRLPCVRASVQAAVHFHLVGLKRSAAHMERLITTTPRQANLLGRHRQRHRLEIRYSSVFATHCTRRIILYCGVEQVARVSGQMSLSVLGEYQ